MGEKLWRAVQVEADILGAEQKQRDERVGEGPYILPYLQRRVALPRRERDEAPAAGEVSRRFSAAREAGIVTIGAFSEDIKGDGCATGAAPPSVVT
jgi:hypothetical protein